MLKTAVTKTLAAMADLLEVQSDNPFQPRAFRNAARALEAVPEEELEELLESRQLTTIPGIGKSLETEILELAKTGTSRRLRALQAAVPVGLKEMMRVPGLGPKKTRQIVHELGVASLEALKKACEEGQVAGVKGFGAKTEKKILEGIAYICSVAGRYRIDQALPQALSLLQHMKGCPAVQRVALGGSLRRGKETVKDIDILTSSTRPDAVADHFVGAAGVVAVVARGETKTSIRLSSGLAADLRIVADEQFPVALQHFTGSKEHNTALRGIAKAQGLKLNEYGLFRGPDTLPIREEEDVYAELGLQFVAPEMREDYGEIALATENRLPELVEPTDLRGMLHVHTDWSDGAATLEEMVEAARFRGYCYVGITDHSQSAFYAGGLPPEKVRRQHEEIACLNAEERGIRIFKGIESDIRPDGSLDYDADVLDLFDFVIASVHSNFNLSEAAMTGRVLRAMEDPHTTFLGHPTGRLLLAREGFSINMDRILEAAADLGVVVEINADPHRLDLNWRQGPRARELGVLTSINPDAHCCAGMDNVLYGIKTARKAGFTKAQVVNALGAEEFEAFVARRRG
jgi:DNA polymerase (family 10)